MRVGYNYAAYNRFGAQIGPDIWVSDDVWAKQADLERQGKVADIPPPPLFDHIDRNLTNLQKMGFSVIRWFVLGNGNNYGPAPTPYLRVPPDVPVSLQRASRYKDYAFSPPSRLDARFPRDFSAMLAWIQKAGMQIIPSLISFEFSSAQRFTVGPRPNTAASGRADVIRDVNKRKIFLDTMLADLLTASLPFKDQIYAWEVANEPVWTVLDIGPNSFPKNWLPHTPEVTFSELRDFLREAIARIDAQHFPSSVGHRYFDDLTRFPPGTAPQFHYYADNSLLRRSMEGPLSAYISDPSQMGRRLFSGSPKPFVGEFNTDHNLNGKPWSELRGHDTTLERLRLLEAAGCELALIWPDVEPSATEDSIRLQPDTRGAIVAYTGGVLPPPDQ